MLAQVYKRKGTTPLRYYSILLFALICFIAASAYSGNPLIIPVRNQSGIPWVEMPVTIPVPAEGLEPCANGWILSGRDILPVQADDLNGDGKPDEILFLVSLASGDATTYTLRANSCGMFFPARAHAGMYLKGFEGPGWESDRIAYRLYWDERNAIDIFGKHNPVLGLKGYATPGVNYHRETPWGMDILAVGPSLGMGSYAIWMDGKIHNVAQADRSYQVVADGPLRAILDLNYDNWTVGTRLFQLKARISILAGQRWTEIELRLRPLDQGPIPEFVTGVVKHEDTVLIRDSRAGILGRWGMQALGPDNKPGGSLLGMGVVVNPRQIVQIEEDAYSSYVRLRGDESALLSGGSPQKESVLRYCIHASWIQETGGADTVTAYETMLRDLAQMKSWDNMR